MVPALVPVLDPAAAWTGAVFRANANNGNGNATMYMLGEPTICRSGGFFTLNWPICITARRPTSDLVTATSIRMGRTKLRAAQREMFRLAKAIVSLVRLRGS